MKSYVPHYVTMISILTGCMMFGLWGLEHLPLTPFLAILEFTGVVCITIIDGVYMYGFRLYQRDRRRARENTL